MRDSVLLDIAWNLPDSEHRLAEIEGLAPKLAKRAGEALLEAVRRSADDDGSYKPPRPPDERQKVVLKEMQSRVAACAAELDIAAETLASKRELSAVIIDGDRDSRLFDGWRAGVVGNDLAELL
jgi:ribonuclease D